MKNAEKQDCIEILDRNHNELKTLHNKTLFVTGATGFIGSAFVKAILYYNLNSNANIKIIALVRDVNRAEKIFASLISDNLFFVEGTVENLPSINYQIDYILHGASMTSSADFVNKPVDTIEITLKGTENILKLAKEKKVESVVYLSTMEIYGAIHDKSNYISESNYGYIDILNVRNSYPQSKKMADTMCLAYAKQYGVNVNIARLTQTIGPSIDYYDTRVAALFARAVIEGRDIILNTKAETTRNIIYITDAISALLILLNNGQSGEAYNVAYSKEVLSIADTAEMIASKIAEGKTKVVFDLKNMEEYNINKELFLQLDTSNIQALGWRAEVDIEEAYRRMIKGMRE